MMAAIAILILILRNNKRCLQNMIFDSNYYKGKRNLHYPLTKDQEKEYRNKVIFILGYGITAIILTLTVIIPNWDIFFK